jgi:2,4-didehydro-3-deoxy-L-rhamnonate hydrolase
VVVVGRRAFHVPASDGWSYVAGVTVGQDLSERTTQLPKPMPQMSMGKSFPGFSPTGPYLVTPDEFSGKHTCRKSTRDAVVRLTVLARNRTHPGHTNTPQSMEKQ